MTLLVSRHLRQQLNKPKVGDLSPNSVKQIGRNGINEATYFLPSFPMEPLDERYANARCITKSDGRWRTENETVYSWSRRCTSPEFHLAANALIVFSDNSETENPVALK